MEALLHLSAAFGLAGAAGLNAYIPLLLLSIMANLGIIHLAPPYDVIGQGWCCAIFAVLCTIEIVVDKVPGADHVNDVVQSFLRPTAGAILFASQAGTITHAHPGVWIVIGLAFSGMVHTTKMMARPVVNLSTVGLGAPVMSTLEDMMSFVMSILALLAPVFVLVGMVAFAWIGWKAFQKVKKHVMRVQAVPMIVPVEEGLQNRVRRELVAGASGWGGGV